MTLDAYLLFEKLSWGGPTLPLNFEYPEAFLGMEKITKPTPISMQPHILDSMQ